MPSAASSKTSPSLCRLPGAWLNVQGEFQVLQRLASYDHHRAVAITSIKIHDTRVAAYSSHPPRRQQRRWNAKQSTTPSPPPPISRQRPLPPVNNSDQNYASKGTACLPTRRCPIAYRFTTQGFKCRSFVLPQRLCGHSPTAALSTTHHPAQAGQQARNRLPPRRQRRIQQIVDMLAAETNCYRC